MTTGHVSVFDATLQKTHVWLREIVNHRVCHDQAKAYSVLRVVLHKLRDRLTPDEAVDLGAQLPMLVRGFYYEGWRPSQTPTRQRTREAFLSDVRAGLRPIGSVDAELAVTVVLGLLGEHVSDGEVEDVALMLPQDIRALWPEGSGPTSGS